MTRAYGRPSESPDRDREAGPPSPSGPGLAFGVILAGVVGWIAVPNAMVADATLETHARMALASAVAAAFWVYRYAERALTRPGNAAVRASLATYFTGWLTIPLIGVPLVLSGPPNGLTPTHPLGFFLQLVPWIVVASVVWAYGLQFAWPVLTASYPKSIGRRLRLSVTENKRAGRILAVSLIVLVAVGPIGLPDVRHLGWQVPPKPSAHRPEFVDVITLVDTSPGNGDVVVSTKDGGSLRLPKASRLGTAEARQGDLVVSAKDPSVWWDTLPETFVGGDALDSSFAWDEGDGLLFPDGLELKKSSDLNTGNIEPTRAFGDSLYALQGCVQVHVNLAAEVVSFAGVCN